MIRPDSHLRKLISTATPEQAARAMAKAKEYWSMCQKLGVEPTEAMRVLREALQMEIDGVADEANDGKEQTDYYNRRRYTHYTEQ